MSCNRRDAEAIASTANALRKELTGDYGERGVDTRVDRAMVERVIGGWPETPQKVARRVIDQYGLPNEATATRLIWFGSGPWKGTIVYRDELPRNFPKLHTDLLEQFIDYRVPIDKFDDLVAFDGSVIAERTRGELSARCDTEAMNFLALNLAHEIVTGRSVEEARRTYAETALAFIQGRSSPTPSACVGRAPLMVLVDDLDALAAGIADRGIKPSKQETSANGVRKVTYRDPDGNGIGLGQPPLSSPSSRNTWSGAMADAAWSARQPAPSSAGEIRRPAT